MKELKIIVFLLVLCPCIIQAQVPGWAWALKATDTGRGAGNGICTDAAGNSYVTGMFVGQLHLGDSILTTHGYEDIFIAKYDSSGTLKWAARAGSRLNDRGQSIA